MPLRNRQRTGDQALVRQINLSLILNNLRKNAPISRAGLAEMTGLNKTTVSSLIQELIDRKFVREAGLEAGGKGRPARLLTLDPAGGYIVSAEIGVDFLSVICTDFAPEVIWRKQENISPELGQHAIIDLTLALLHEGVRAGCGYCDSLLGVAVGIPGLVDQDTGRLLLAPNLGWQNVPLREILERESFSAPVYVDNEANMAALGELYFGAAQGYEEVLYISAGVGLGGGFVYNGLLFRGSTGYGTEFGHMTVNPDGELCNCGNRGCWETEVSQRALLRKVREGLNGGSSELIALIGGDPDSLTVPLIVEAAHAGDPLSLEAINEIGHHLGVGIASLVNALNPELVVFGGILSLAGDILLPAIENELNHRALRWNREATEVVQARHGFDACVMGGVATVYQSILTAPGVVRSLAV
jgi:glucokinase-like ROK family protein